jgi:hypothetical protein
MAIGLRRKFASGTHLAMVATLCVTATFTNKFTAGTCCFFLPKSFFFIALHTRDGKLVSSSKFPIGLMISGKFVVVLCEGGGGGGGGGGKPPGRPKAKGRLFWECPCPKAFPGVKTVTLKLINFKKFMMIPGGYQMGITVLDDKSTRVE